jgi:hypothetical protein
MKIKVMNLEKFLKDFIVIFIIVSIIYWMFDFIKKMFTKETALVYWVIFLAVTLTYYLLS